MITTCSCCGLEGPVVEDKLLELDGKDICNFCYFMYKDELREGKVKTINGFIKRFELRSFSAKFNMTDELTHRILDRKFEARSLDELLLAVKVLPKMNMYDSIFLITDCFTRIFAKFRELEVNSQKSQM